MRRLLSRRVALLTCAGLALASAAGCASNKSYDKFIPKEDAARVALETVLTSWQNGDKPGTISTTKIPIEVIDSKWKSGQKLNSYQIVGSEPGQGPRWFSVKLVLQKPAGEQTVKYVVVGNSPLWVYREEDYNKASGMGG